MNRRNWLWTALLAIPVAVGGGLAYASTTTASGFPCPITGETLPCGKCCPLNGEKGPAAVATEGEFVCPVTGEKLGCPNCCPLNKAK